MKNKFYIIVWLLLAVFFAGFAPVVGAVESARESEPQERQERQEHHGPHDHRGRHDAPGFGWPDVPRCRLLHPDLLLPGMYQVPRLNMALAGDLLPVASAAPLKKQKRLKRTLWFGLAHFVYATASYWIRQDVMREDWEYQLSWKDQKRRFLFLDGMRFDSNVFPFNWTHSLAGAVYYNYARANHYGRWKSFWFGVASSTFWEFVVEFKEMVSINDMIGTPVGGFSIGEAMFQLGRFFRGRKTTPVNRVLGFLANPILKFNEWLDGKKGRNQYLFDHDVWHDIRLGVGGRHDGLANGLDASPMHLGLESRLVLIPGFGQAGTARRWVKKTLATEYNVNGKINKKGLYEFDIFARAVISGYFSQDISDGKGYSLFLGLSSAFEVFRRFPATLPGYDEDDPQNAVLPDIEDKYTLINLLGPTLDLSLFAGDFSLRWTTDLFGDFSMVHGHAFKHYRARHTFGSTKATLQNHGYYYALGFTLASGLDVAYGNLELRGLFKYHYFDSIEGLDRFQRDMAPEDDFDLKDWRRRYRLSVGYRLPGTATQLVLGVEQTARKGWIGDFVRQSSENRWFFRVNYIL